MIRHPDDIPQPPEHRIFRRQPESIRHAQWGDTQPMPSKLSFWVGVVLAAFLMLVASQLHGR